MNKENIVSKNIGILLYRIKEQTNDLLVLKKLSESNIIIKDPESIIEIISKQIQITQELINKSYTELYNNLYPKSHEQEVKPKDKKQKEVEEEIDDEEEIAESEEDIDSKDTGSEDISELIDTEYIPSKNLKSKNGISEDLKKKIEEL